MVSQKCYETILQVCERHRAKRIERERVEREAARTQDAEDRVAA
jgi:hypothetical protein